MKHRSLARFAGKATLLAAVTTLATTPATHAIVLQGVDGDGINSENLFIDDGGGDIFDGGMVLDSIEVGGVFGLFIADTFVDTDPSYFGSGDVVEDDSEDELGVHVERRVRGIDSNGTTEVFDADDDDIDATDHVYVRYLDTFTNTSDDPLTLEIEYFSDMGSDDSNAIQTEDIDGDSDEGEGFGADLETNDRWFIHGQNNEDADDGDPVAGFVLHDGTLEIPTDVFASGDSDFDDDDLDGDEDIEWTYELELEPGETKSLLYFLTARNLTDEFDENPGQDDDAREDLEILLGIDIPGGEDDDETATIGFVDTTLPISPFSIDERFLDGIDPELGDTIVNFTDLRIPGAGTGGDPIPEPLTGALALFSIGSLAAWNRRRRNA